MTCLGDIVTVIKGNNVLNTIDHFEEGSVRYIQIEDLRSDNTMKFTFDLNGALARKSDILIAWDGANAGTIGFNLEGIIGSTISILRPLININSFYLAYYLKSKFEEIKKNRTGATIPHVSRQHLERLVVPIPDKKEQQRIAAILQKADRIRHLRRTARELSDQYLQSVFLEMFGDKKVYQKKYDIFLLEQLANVVSGVTKGQKYGNKPTIEVDYLRVANVQDGYLDLSEIKSISVLPEEAKKLALVKNDILMTEGGDFDKLGRGAIWNKEIDYCIHQNHIFRVRLDKNKVHPEFFESYLQTKFVKEYFLMASKRTTNLASINITQLKNLPVIVPGLKEQNQYIDLKVKFKMLKNKQREAERQSEQLFQSLLNRAFNGGI